MELSLLLLLDSSGWCASTGPAASEEGTMMRGKGKEDKTGTDSVPPSVLQKKGRSLPQPCQLHLFFIHRDGATDEVGTTVKGHKC
eukprot:631652-Pelagomonas_calceolata.AAC.3